MKHLPAKWVLLLCSVPLVICLLPFGCRVGYVWHADRAVKPIIRAIESFKSQTGRLPTMLSELAEQKKGSRGLKLESSSDVGLVWSISYQNNSNGTYALSFNHVHYDIYYENGKRRDVRFNFFR